MPYSLNGDAELAYRFVSYQKRKGIVPFSIKANGSVSAGGTIHTQNGGIDSTTYVSTGRLRLNFVVPYESASSYMALANGTQADGGTLVYWTRLGALTTTYMEVLTYYGNVAIFNPTNPTAIYFEARELAE